MFKDQHSGNMPSLGSQHHASPTSKMMMVLSRDKVLDERGVASFICKGRCARALSDGVKDSFQRKEFKPSIRVAMHSYDVNPNRARGSWGMPTNGRSLFQ